MFVIIFIIIMSTYQWSMVYSYLRFGDKRHHHRSNSIIYIDLGTNCGASITSFISRAITKTYNDSEVFDITGDGSSIPGKGFGRVDHLKKDNFHVIAVEANNMFTDSILEHKDKLMKNKTVKSFTLYNGTAISTKSGITEFIFDNKGDGIGSSGSSMNNESISVINGTRIKVKMMDICELFKVNEITVRDYVILKIDIEGSEYDLVRRLITTGYLSKYIDQIAIEWHHQTFILGEGYDKSYLKTEEEKMKRVEIVKKYENYYNHLMFILSDDAFKHVKIFEWGR